MSGDTTYTFANEPAAREAGISTDDMVGKTMAAVMGPVQANTYAKINRDVLSDFEIAEREGHEDARDRAKQAHLQEFGEDDDIKVIKSDHVPLRGDRDHPPGVLMVLNDITELTVEKRRSERMLGKLINTLVGVVDRRNPYATDLSSRTAEVARAIAEEMELSDQDIKTADTAAKLLGVGTVFVPTAVLTKKAPLTPQEQQMIDNAYQVSAELLKDVPFDGPVVEAIRQAGERWNGRGTARHPGRGHPQTGAGRHHRRRLHDHGQRRRPPRRLHLRRRRPRNLLGNAGTRFDRRPVTALINILHNREGARRWAHFRKRPQAAAE